MKKITALMLAAFITIMPFLGYAQEKNANVETRLEKIASDMISNYGVTSIQYAIIDNGSIINSGNKGVFAKNINRAITPDTMYGIASLSKMYVCTSVMMLQDSGKLDIDKPLTQYIPEFKMEDPRYKKITPRMLMNHSSGLYGSHYYNVSLFNDNDFTVQENLLKNLQTENLNSNPGEFSVYCNDGFQLLEILVERVSNMSYTEFIKEYISTPLKLENTKTPLDKFNRDQLAKIYDDATGYELPNLSINLLGTGGIYSTAEEICKFSQVLMGEKEEILSKESALKMQNEEYKNGIWVSDSQNILGYGLGWDSTNLYPFSEYGIKAVAKGGDGSYHSSLIVLPEYNIAMAVVSSGGSSIYNQTFASSVLLELLKQKGVIKDIKPNKVSLIPTKAPMPKEMTKYEGTYGIGTVAGRTYEVEFNKDGFTVLPQLDGMIPKQEFIYIGDNEFKDKSGVSRIKFTEAKNGKTYIQAKSLMDLPQIGQAILTDFQGVKLEKNNLENNVLENWKKRDGKKYFAILEKANSNMYLTPFMMSKKIDFDEKYGYVQGCKIIDRNNAVAAVQIPVMNGRDLTDMEFYVKDGIEYLKTIDMTFISEDAVKVFDSKSNVNITIPSESKAIWFKLDKSTDGKNIDVKLPKDAAFAVYTEDGKCLNYTVVSGTNSMKLPERGMIVFAGKSGDIFKINIK